MAGEDFEVVGNLLGGDQRRQEILQFLCQVLPACRALILTLALPKLWAECQPGATASFVHAEFERRLNAYARFVLFAKVARWLARTRQLSKVQTNVYLEQAALDRDAAKAKRLDIPVFVNLSMADACQALKTPDVERPHDLRMATNVLSSVTIDANKSDPLIVGYLYLNLLFVHLREHVRWFKFDFSHAYDTGDVKTQPTNRPRIGRGCRAAHLLLNHSNWGGWTGSTRSYLSLYRLLNGKQWHHRIAAVLGADTHVS
jgi:hypothetical protein